MCKHLKKVGDNFPINNKLSLQKEASRKHPRIVDTGLSWYWYEGFWHGPSYTVCKLWRMDQHVHCSPPPMLNTLYYSPFAKKLCLVLKSSKLTEIAKIVFLEWTLKSCISRTPDRLHGCVSWPASFTYMHACIDTYRVLKQCFLYTFDRCLFLNLLILHISFHEVHFSVRYDWYTSKDWKLKIQVFKLTTCTCNTLKLHENLSSALGSI